MRADGWIRADGRYWLIGCDALDVETQGTSPDDACAMLADAIKSLYGTTVRVTLDADSMTCAVEVVGGEGLPLLFS